MATVARSQERLLTAEELAQLPEDKFTELVDGHLVTMTPAYADHGSVAARTTAALARWVFGRELGELFDSSTGFILRRDPDVVRMPDVAFVSSARLAQAGWTRRAFLELGPDLVVEVLSASNTVAEMTRRIADYLSAGTQLIWVLDPASRTASVHTPRHLIAQRLDVDDALDGGDVLPGFSLPLARCFAGLAPLAP